MTSLSNQHRRGFSLTELAIVLSVIGALLGAIWVAAQGVSSNNRANQAAQDIIQIASNVRSTYMGANTFTDSNTDEVANGKFIAANIIPADLVTGAATAKNSWLGNVAVIEGPTTNTPAGVAANRDFRISFCGTPADACMRIASQLANLGTNDQPIQFTTKGGAACGKGGTAVAIPVTGLPMSAAAPAASIAAACALNTTAANSSTEFDFKIH